ncbi:MAG TPA: type II secretion system minor pseudopilin GspK [Legionellaceae bacterium]|nr:type II secretion system minor pseudopilin GspK [Legionellaceae bacterium]
MVKFKGSALLTTLFIITLVAIIATAMSVRIRNNIHRSALIETTDKLYLASQAVTFWAMDRLNDPKQSFNHVNTIGKVLSFPKALQSLYPNTVVQGDLFDLQSRFNLNNLYDERYHSVFYNLLENLGIGDTSIDRKERLDAVIHWLRPPQNSDVPDEWHDKYAKQNPIYFPSQMPMYHSSELRMVYGFSAQDYRKIAPYIAVFPESVGININTTSKKILLSLNASIKEEDVSTIINQRAIHPIKDIREISVFTEKYHIPPELLSVESHYFLVVATAKSADLSMQLYVILQRQQSKKGTWHTHLLSQSINTP